MPDVAPSRSGHLVDPELAPALAFFQTEVNADTLAQMRGVAFSGWAGRPARPDAPVERIERMLPGPDGAPDVSSLIYRPEAPASTPRPILFTIHGGGYVLGSPDATEPRNAARAADLDCIVVAPAYRLGPEAPFPAAIEDCYAALAWVHANAASLGAAADRIVIGGESAGGGLAAGLALLARDRGAIPLAGQILIYPMIDDRTGSGRDPAPFAGEFVWTAGSNRFGWSAYLGQAPGGDQVSPYAAAARAENLSGLPPTAILTAALDLFVEENIDYARRLIVAGVPTDLRVYAGAFHGFDVMESALAAQLVGEVDVIARRMFRQGLAGPAAVDA